MSTLVKRFLLFALTFILAHTITYLIVGATAYQFLTRPLYEGHGGGSLLGPTICSAITTPAQALDSADNLAQLVAELETFGGKTDACARARE